MKEYKNLRETHILKLIMKGKGINEENGIKCYPRQTYGVSEDSPDIFKTKNGIISERGYIFDEEKLNRHSPLSQNKFFSLFGNPVEAVDNFKEKYN